MTGEDAAVVPSRHQNDGELDRVWAMRQGEGFGRRAYEAAARRMGQIDASWSRTATACSHAHPCYSCCLRALRALEAALTVVTLTDSLDQARGIAHAALNREEYHGEVSDA